MNKLSIGLDFDSLSSLEDARNIGTHYPSNDFFNIQSKVDAIKKSNLQLSWRETLVSVVNKECRADCWLFNDIYLLLYKLGNGEFRPVYISNSGHILDHPESLPSLQSIGIIDHLKGLNHSSGSLLSNAIYVEKAIWSFFSSNYTHYLQDEFVHQLYVNILIQSLGFNHKPIAPLLRLKTLPHWQKQFYGQCFKETLDLYVDSNVTCFKIGKIILPVVENVCHKSYLLSNFVENQANRFYDYTRNRDAPHNQIQSSFEVTQPWHIVFSSRSDERSDRVKNLKELISLSKSIYKTTVWDPAKMSLAEKKQYLNSLQGRVILVCEGSGIMNAILFSSCIEKVIYLVDPNTLTDPSFLHGGYAYYLSILDRTELLVGKIWGEIDGSPLKSIVFSLKDFQDTLACITNT